MTAFIQYFGLILVATIRFLWSYEKPEHSNWLVMMSLWTVGLFYFGVFLAQFLLSIPMLIEMLIVSYYGLTFAIRNAT